MRAVLARLVREEERSTAETLKARAWWMDLRDLSPAEQLTRIRNVASLQSFPMFEVILSEARSVAPSDPHLGAQFAKLAFCLAQTIPGTRFPQEIKKDLQADALIALANCLRLSADWQGSTQALEGAARLLLEGTGDAAIEAELLSIRSLLSADTGNYENARAYSSQAADRFRRLGDWVSFSKITIAEADALLTSGREKEAITKARQLEGLLGPADAHLQLLANGIIIEGHVAIGLVPQALHLFARAKPLFDRAASATARLRVMRLQARLLDGLECTRESEMLFDLAFHGFLEMELYKDAYLTLLTLFEMHCKRGVLAKAAAVCRLALSTARQMGSAVNLQIQAAWEQLLSAVTLGQIGKGELSGARQILVQYWNIPPKSGLLSLQEAFLERRSEIPASSPPAPPQKPTVIGADSYQEARDAYDKELIVSAYRATGGNISETSRRLGISRPTLRARLRKYGIMPDERM